MVDGYDSRCEGLGLGVEGLMCWMEDAVGVDDDGRQLVTVMIVEHAAAVGGWVVARGGTEFEFEYLVQGRLVKVEVV